MLDLFVKIGIIKVEKHCPVPKLQDTFGIWKPVFTVHLTKYIHYFNAELQRENSLILVTNPMKNNVLPITVYFFHFAIILCPRKTCLFFYICSGNNCSSCTTVWRFYGFSLPFFFFYYHFTDFDICWKINVSKLICLWCWRFATWILTYRSNSIYFQCHF